MAKFSRSSSRSRPPSLQGFTGAPPYVRPVLDALHRLQDRSVFTPSEGVQQACRLLADRFGEATAPAATGVARGAAGLLAEHTHYAPGFALLQPLPFGTAVALRPCVSADTQVAFDDTDGRWTLSSETRLPPETPSWVRVVEAVLHRLAPASPGLEVAVVTTIPASFRAAYWAALAVALARALSGHTPPPDVLTTLQAALEEVLGRPFSVAYLKAAATVEGSDVTLVDTITREHLPVPSLPAETLAWAVVEVETSNVSPSTLHRDVDRLDTALSHLRAGAFTGLTTLRDLEHQDLQRALTLIPSALRPITRYVIGDNRRVPRMVAALRRQDPQMLGALLLMSHHAARTDALATSHAADAVVEQIQARTAEGLFGAALVDPNGAVLVAGRPYVLPQALDQLTQDLAPVFTVSSTLI
ncbi:MAG: hypothetical protein AAF970_05675 [Bacteroidota bacterium]